MIERTLRCQHKLLVMPMILLFGFGIASSRAVEQDTVTNAKPLSTPKNFDVFETLLDMSLGLSTEPEIKAKLKTANIKNFQSELESKLTELKGNRMGYRKVDAKRFSDLIDSMDVVSSSRTIRPIGTSKRLAYLEYNLFLTSKHRYVAIVVTDLSKLPKSVVKKLK